MTNHYALFTKEFEAMMDVPKSKQLFISFLKQHRKDQLLEFIEQVDRLALLRYFSNQKKKAKEIIAQFMPYLYQGKQLQVHRSSSTSPSSASKLNKRYVQIPKELQQSLVQSIITLKESITRTNEVTECFKQVRDFVHMKLITIWFPVFRMTNEYLHLMSHMGMQSTGSSESSQLETFFREHFFEEDITITKQDLEFVASQMELQQHSSIVIQSWDSNIVLLSTPVSNIEVVHQQHAISLACYQMVALLNMQCTSALEALLQYSNSSQSNNKIVHEMLHGQSHSPSSEKFSHSLHKRECKQQFPHSNRVFLYGQACTYDATNKKYYVVLKSGNLALQGQQTIQPNSFLYEGYCLEQINPFQTKMTRIGWVHVGKSKGTSLNKFVAKQTKLFVEYMLQYPVNIKLQDTTLMELFQQNLVHSKSFSACSQESSASSSSSSCSCTLENNIVRINSSF